MLSKNLNKPRRKPGAITVAVLSLLLGAQIAAFADYYQYPFDYGFNSGRTAKLAGLSPSEAAAYDVGRCTGHFTLYADINECEYAASLAYFYGY